MKTRIPNTITYHNHPKYKPVFLYRDLGNGEFATNVVLLDKEDNFKPTRFGQSIKSKKDKLNLRLGREIAFGRALKQRNNFCTNLNSSDYLEEVLTNDELDKFNQARENILKAREND